MGIPAMADRSAETATSDLSALKDKAPEAAEFLRLLANPSRLLLLCHISQGERSVNEIQRDLGLKQPALSQQLGELRQADLVQTRRESRSIYYTIKDRRVQALVEVLHDLFCNGAASQPATLPAASPADGMAARSTRPSGDAAAFARLEVGTAPDRRRSRTSP